LMSLPAGCIFLEMLFLMKVFFLSLLFIQMPVPNYNMKFSFFLNILGVQQYMNMRLMLLLTCLTICKIVQKIQVTLLVL
jgi:hypothetical protein